MEQIRIVDPNGKEIGRIILDAGRLELRGFAERLRDAKVSDAGKPVTTADAKLWFELAYQLATPYSQMYPVKPGDVE